MNPTIAQQIADQRGYVPLPPYTSRRVYGDGDLILQIRHALTPMAPRWDDQKTVLSEAPRHVR